MEQRLDLSGMMNPVEQQVPVTKAPAKKQAPVVKTQKAPVTKAPAKKPLTELDKEYMAMNIELEQKLQNAHSGNGITLTDSVMNVKEWSDEDIDNCPIYLNKLTNDDFISLLDLLNSINQAQDFILSNGFVCNEIVGDIMVIDVRDKDLPDYLDLSEFKILYDWLKTASDGFKLDVWLKVQKINVGNRVQTYMTYVTPVSMQSLMTSGINIGEGNISQYHDLAATKAKIEAAGDTIKKFTIPLRSYKIIKPIIGLYKSYPFLKNRNNFGDSGLFIFTQNASNNKESETKIFDRDVFHDSGYDISNDVKFSKTSFEFPFESDVVVELYPMFDNNDNKSDRKFTALIHSTVKKFEVKLLYVGALSTFNSVSASSTPISIDALEL